MDVYVLFFLQTILYGANLQQLLWETSIVLKFTPLVSILLNYLKRLLHSYHTNLFERPLRWKRMVACKRGLGSGPLSFFSKFRSIVSFFPVYPCIHFSFRNIQWHHSIFQQLIMELSQIKLIT
jgi:hypothetical protein